MWARDPWSAQDMSTYHNLCSPDPELSAYRAWQNPSYAHNWSSPPCRLLLKIMLMIQALWYLHPHHLSSALAKSIILIMFILLPSIMWIFIWPPSSSKLKTIASCTEFYTHYEVNANLIRIMFGFWVSPTILNICSACELLESRPGSGCNGFNVSCVSLSPSRGKRNT